MASRRQNGRKTGARSRSGAGGRARSRAAAPSTTLKPPDLRWNCQPLRPGKKVPTAAFLLGQERPMDALRTGLSLYAPGYNIFVSGLMGSGRTVVVQYLLRDINPACRIGPDRVYVHNFREPNRPRLISLPPGTAQAFREEMQALGRDIHDALRGALRSRPHRTARRVVVRASEARERRVMEALGREAQRLGCALVRFQAEGGASNAADIYPLHEGEPVAPDVLSTLVVEGKLDEATRDRLLANREQLIERLEEVAERMRREGRRVDRELREMDRKLAWRLLDSQFRDFKTRWPQPQVVDFLQSAGEHLERHLEAWTGQELAEAEPVEEAEGSEAGEAERNGTAAESPTKFAEFDVQVVKTRAGEDCPVIIETNPTYANLFGTIDPPRETQTSYLNQIHAGAVLRADGGYLILRAADVLREPGVWPQLKRALQAGRVEIREFDPSSGTTTGALQPEPVPIDVKVVLIGEPGVYEALANEDAQFPQIFKIHSEFDSTIAVNRQNLRRYADYLAWLSRREGLRAFTPESAAAVAEFGARASGRRDRLITAFGELGDLAREASHLCEQSGPGPVTRDHVEAAVRARRYRHDLPQELVERDYSSGYMRLSTSGKAVGQINALTVLDTGTLEFGRPCRITANTGMAVGSRTGLINIEGEAELSGPIHNKGIMILEGYLLMTFGNDGPLCLQATVCFEQLYHGVEGDSASLAQLMALLSSLAGVPLEQGTAVTGSINQKGEVQAVSAVNEKIEGFFRLCSARRLTGRQGVVMPRANVPDLMLDHDVVHAVGEGRFHVHAVERVEEALEIFTGRPAVEVLGKVRKALARFRELADRHGTG